MKCKKYTKETNLYPNHGYGKKIIFETIAMKKSGETHEHMHVSSTIFPISGWVFPQSHIQHVSVKTWQMKHDYRYNAFVDFND
jgi:hypothetical protein